MILALLVGAGMLLVNVLAYAMATAPIVRLLVYLTRAGRTASGFWREVAVMMVVALITAAMHLTQIALWAVVFLVWVTTINLQHNIGSRSPEGVRGFGTWQ